VADRETGTTEGNARLISSRLGLDTAQAENVAGILEGSGIGGIKSLTKEDDSDEYAYFITIQDESGAAYYVSLSANGKVTFISKDGENGEIIYHEPVDSMSDEEREYIRDTIEGLEE
jgi:hypothetical protein